MVSTLTSTLQHLSLPSSSPLKLRLTLAAAYDDLGQRGPFCPTRCCHLHLVHTGLPVPGAPVLDLVNLVAVTLGGWASLSCRCHLGPSSFNHTPACFPRNFHLAAAWFCWDPENAGPRSQWVNQSPKGPRGEIEAHPPSVTGRLPSSDQPPGQLG